MIHRMGYRFRLHVKDLPGKPDIVLPRHRKVIFVHGCFWHGHRCKKGRRPASNRSFWNAKLDANLARDKRYIRALRRAGWSVLVVWQCQIERREFILERLRRFLEG